jgi:hypothetical protein
MLFELCQRVCPSVYFHHSNMGIVHSYTNSFNSSLEDVIYQWLILTGFCSWREWNVSYVSVTSCMLFESRKKNFFGTWTFLIVEIFLQY